MGNAATQNRGTDEGATTVVNVTDTPKRRKAPIKIVVQLPPIAAPAKVADAKASDAQTVADAPAPDPMTAAIARHNAHLAANPILRDRLERVAATQRAFDEQRTRNHPKAAR